MADPYPPELNDIDPDQLAQAWDDLMGPEDRKVWIRNYDRNNLGRYWALSQIKDGESVLDVGCGPGLMYELLQESHKQVTYRGVDISPGFVQACQELFPEGDFTQGNAMQLDVEDNSYDCVLLSHVLEHTPNFQDPLLEAFRVARRRVIVLMWRPLLEGDKPSRYVAHKQVGSNDYNSTEFREVLHSFRRNLTERAFVNQQRPNWGWVIHKTLDDCVFDLDDFYEDCPGIEWLIRLHEIYPHMKATLFTIPDRCTREFLYHWSSKDWVELAAHGWTHEPNTECESWTYNDAQRYLDRIEDSEYFVRGFKAPGWRVNEDVVMALAERDFWWAAHYPDRPLIDKYKPRYYMAANNPLSVHGHMQNIEQPNPLLRNGVEQLIYERGLPWDKYTKFHFVSEVARAP